MREYRDTQGNVTGTSEQAVGAIERGCLGGCLLPIVVFIGACLVYAFAQALGGH